MTTRDEYLKQPVDARLARLARTADDLAAAIRSHDGTTLSRRPEPKAWSAKEVVCHLDAERWAEERHPERHGRGARRVPAATRRGARPSARADARAVAARRTRADRRARVLRRARRRQPRARRYRPGAARARSRRPAMIPTTLVGS